jgi:peptidyl-prolyl cis-trans isomerase D
MLEAMRRNSRNAIIYVLFGIIIAVFVINFGPGSRGCTPGAQASNVAAKVGGSTLTEQDFRFAYIALGGSQFPGQLAKDRRLKEFVMDKLIERELLAQEAERLGFVISAKEVEDMIGDGRMMVMGVPRRVDAYVFKDGKFDYERFKMVSQNQLGVSVVRFIEIERRELLADRTRELIKAGTKVSPDEVKADFEQRGLQVNLEYARFSPRRYEDDAEPAAADIDAYIKKHEGELKKAYEDRAFLYKKLERQARLRHMVVEVAKDAPEADVQKAKRKIDQAAARVQGGAPFATVAGETTSEARTQKRGGSIGWKKKGFTGFGDALDAKVFAAKKGEVVGPERTDRGFELVLVEDFREGDVPFAVAEREIAEGEVQKERAKDKAKAEAQAVLDRVKKGDKLEGILPKDTAKEGGEAEDGKSPQKTIEKLMKQSGDAPKLQETGLFSRRGELVQDIGVSKELAKKAFELKVGETAGPFDASGSWVIVRAKEHKDPDLADYDKRKAELQREFARTKWAQLVDEWSKQRCAEVRDDGRIKVNDEILSYEGIAPPGRAGAAERVKYEPCAGTRLF